MFKFLKVRRLKNETRKALADGVLDEHEKRRLAKVADELGVSTGPIQAAREDDYRKRMQPIIKGIISKRRMTKNDLEEIFAIADNLGIEPNLGRELDMCWLMNAWEQGDEFELPKMKSTAFLKQGEICHFCGSSVWSQLKIVKTRLGSHGFSSSIKIMKGVRYRIGTVRPAHSQSEELVDLSSGELIITNKRLVFNGDKKSMNIQLNRLINLDLHGDGIEMSKGSGKNEFFRLSPLDAEFAYMLISQLLN
jgi:hypothetical protein